MDDFDKEWFDFLINRLETGAYLSESLKKIAKREQERRNDQMG